MGSWQIENWEQTLIKTAIDLYPRLLTLAPMETLGQIEQEITREWGCRCRQIYQIYESRAHLFICLLGFLKNVVIHIFRDENYLYIRIFLYSVRMRKIWCGIPQCKASKSAEFCRSTNNFHSWKYELQNSLRSLINTATLWLYLILCSFAISIVREVCSFVNTIVLKSILHKHKKI